MQMVLLFVLCFFVVLVFIVLFKKNNKKIDDNFSFKKDIYSNELQSINLISEEAMLEEKRDDVIDARNFDLLKLSFNDNALVDMKNQFKLSNIQMDALINAASNSYNKLIIDLGGEDDEDGEEDVRYIPVQFSINSSILNHDQTYVCNLYLKDNVIYSYEIYDRWIDQHVSMDQAYHRFVQKIETLLKQGWRNYYFPHEVRYAASCEERLLEEQQRMVLVGPDILSFEQFSNCLNSENKAIYLYLYLDNVYMNILFSDCYSAFIELEDMKYDLFYKNHFPEMMDDEDYSVCDYKSKALLCREKSEQEAKKQGYEIDEDYIDPVS